MSKATRDELELFQCKNVVYRYVIGQGKVDIKRAMNLPYSTHSIIETYNTYTTGTRRSRFGRLKTHFDTDKQYIVSKSSEIPL